MKFLVSACFVMGFLPLVHAQVLLPDQSPNPAFSNLVYWVDASDPATISFSGGTTVASWQDKSAGARLMTPVTGTSITLSTGGHGQPAVIFTGASGMQFTPDLVVPVNDADGMSAFVVAKTDVGTNRSTLMSRGGANVQFFREADGQNGIIFYKGSNPDPNIPTADIKVDHVQYATMNATLSDPDKVRYFVDGVSQTVNNNQNIGTQDWVLNRLGGNGGCCGNWNGEISEILVFDRVLDTDEENDIGAYLAAKYGLSTSYEFTNPAPVISNLDGDMVTHTPGMGATILDAGTAASISDPLPLGASGWSNGTLRVSFGLGNQPADDALGILDEGSAAGQISFDGANLSYEGTVIGTASGGSGGADMVITFNGNASSEAISALLDNVVFMNSNTGTSPLSRLIHFTPTDGDGALGDVAEVVVALNVGGAVNTLVWQGDESTDFNTAGNWDGNAVPDSNDVAIFRDAGAGTVDLGAGASVGEIRFDGSGSFVLENAVLTVSKVAQQAVASGSNTIASIISGVSLDVDVAGGALSLSSLDNAYTGIITVHSNATVYVDVLDTQSGLGNASVDLNGGTLELVGLDKTINDALHHYGYQPTDPNPENNDLDLDQNGGLLGNSLDFGGDPTAGRGYTARTLFTDGPAGRGLDFNGDGDFAATGVITQNDQYMNLFIGTLTVSPADEGIWGFRRATDDDRMGIWLDLNQNGIFESSTPGLGSNRGEQLVWDGFSTVVTNFLAAGDYLVAFTHLEFAGGSQVDIRLQTPNLAEEVVKPTDPDQAGFFSVMQKSEGILGNSVRLLADSTIRGNSVTTLAAFDVTSSLRVTVEGVGVAFSSALLSGTLSVVSTEASRLELTGVAGPGGISQDGNGLVLLGAGNSYEGLTTVNTGMVEVAVSNGLGSDTQGTVVNEGGSLRFVSGTHSDAIEIHGAGNSDSRGALSGIAGGNSFITGLVSVPVDAEIYCGGNELFLDGGIDVAGTNLHFFARNRINVRINGISGGADARLSFDGPSITDLEIASPAFEGDIELIGNGWVEAHRSGALGDGFGVTRVVSDEATLLFRNLGTQVENLEIVGDGRGGNGSLRIENNTQTLQGSITLTGDTLLHARNNSTFNVLGSVTGGFNVAHRENGTIVFAQDNDIANYYIDNGGKVRIQTVGGLGTTPLLTLDAGERLEFDGTMSFDGSTLGGVVLNGGELVSLSGQTTLDIPVGVGAESDLLFGGNGDLEVVQAIGNGDQTIPAPGALSHFGFHLKNNNLLMNLHDNEGMVNGVPPNPGAATNLDFYAETLLVNGPGGRGLDFNGDADWQNAGAIATNRSDNYSNLIIGYLNVSAHNAGDWQFRRLADDDQIGIWLDLDKDGIFESDPVGFGSNRGEQIQWDGDSGVKTHTLTAGRYLFAVTHGEGTGNSRARVQFKSPLMGLLQNIKPGDPKQAGLWESLNASLPEFAVTNGLLKTGTGTLTLHGDNSFNQEVYIDRGFLIAGHENALGTYPDVHTLQSGIGLSGDITLTKTLRVFGGSVDAPGILVNVTGDNFFNGDILTTNAYPLTAEIACLEGRLEVGAPGSYDFRAYANAVTFSGDGDVLFNNDISNLNATINLNGFLHYGYHFRNNGVAMDLNNNGGMYNNGDPEAFQNYFGTSILTSGPDGRGLDFNLDQDFQDAGAIDTTRNDNYHNLFVTELVVPPTEVGDWEFRRVADDDQMGIWLDIDQDGIFESTTPGLGSDRGEQLQWDNDGAAKIVNLAAGRYLFAVTHSEGASGSQVHVEFKAPSMPGRVTIKPSDPAQDGFWQLTFDAGNTVRKEGAGTLTLAGDNTYTGPTVIEAGTLIPATFTALGNTGDGTLVDGGTLALPANTLWDTGEAFQIGGMGDTNYTGALVSLGGITGIQPPTTISAPSGAYAMGIGAEQGTFTISSQVDLQNALLRIDGSGDIVFSDRIIGLGSGTPALTYAQEVLSDSPLLYYQFEETTGTNVANIGLTGGVDDGTVFDAAHTDLNVPGAFPALGSAVGFNNDPLTGITTPFSVNVLSSQFAIEAWVYSNGAQDNRSGVAGQNDAYEFGMANTVDIEMWNPSGGAFRTPYPKDQWFHLVSTGDGMNRSIYINGVLVASNATTTANYGNSGFTFNIGGQGIQDASNNAFNGVIDEVALYNRPLSASDVQRHFNAGAVIAPDNRVVKFGTGRLYLNGNSTFNGGVTLSAGRVFANGNLATGTGPVTVEEATVLGGTGVLGGETMIQTRGALSPGASPGIMIVNSDLSFNNFSSTYVAEMTGSNSSDVDLVAVAGNLFLNNATLDVQRDPAYTPSASDVLLVAVASSITGTFNGLPEGALLSAQGAEFSISYAGGNVLLSATGGQRVFAGKDVITRQPDSPVTVSTSVLTSNDGVGAGAGPLVVTAVNTPGLDGGSVVLTNNTVIYTPPAGYEGNDSFTYVVSDGTHSTTGLVDVFAVVGSSDPAVGDVSGLTVQQNGDYRIQFSGTPGGQYDIEWTESLDAPINWTVLGAVTADSSGILQIDHTDPPEPAVYYRAVVR